MYCAGTEKAYFEVTWLFLPDQITSIARQYDLHILLQVLLDIIF